MYDHECDPNYETDGAESTAPRCAKHGSISCWVCPDRCEATSDVDRVLLCKKAAGHGGKHFDVSKGYSWDRKDEVA